MTPTYDVRVWHADQRHWKGGVTYRVRWRVGSRHRSSTFRTRSLADSFRSELLSAARRGEAFDTDTCMPTSASRTGADINWYDFACSYVDMKWKSAAGKYRKSIAEALTTVTMALFRTERGMPDPVRVRSALQNWAFNSKRRDSCPEDIAAVLRWVRRNTDRCRRWPIRG